MLDHREPHKSLWKFKRKISNRQTNYKDKTIDKTNKNVYIKKNSNNKIHPTFVKKRVVAAETIQVQTTAHKKNIKYIKTNISLQMDKDYILSKRELDKPRKVGQAKI